MLEPTFTVLDAISYKRFSSGRQAKGNSIARQDDLETKYAIAHGLRIMGTYLDAGVSAYDGTNGDLGDLRRLLDAAQAGQFPRGTPMLVESLDRLSRKAAWRAHRLFSDLILAGLAIVTVGDEQVYSEASLDEDSMRFMMSIAIMIRSNDESKTKSSRSLDNRAREREKIRSTKTLIGRKKTWADRGPDGKGVANDKAPTVLRIYQDAASGYGAMKIAARLNDSGVKPFGGGERWYPGSVLSILNDDAVMGIFQPHRYEKLPGGRRSRVSVGDAVEGYYPVVVPPALVERAREGLRNRFNARGRSGPTWANLVKGLCRCAVCKGRVHHFERVRGYPYLRCYAATGVRGCSNHVGFPYKRLEAMLYWVRETHRAISEILPKTPDESANRLAELEARAARLAERIDALVDDLEIIPVGPAREAVQRRLAERGDEQLKLRQEITEARHAVRVAEGAAVQDETDRFAEAYASMQADDPIVRRDARMQVAAQYQRVIERVILHSDRRITIQMKLSSFGNRIEYALSPEGIDDLIVTLPDGTTIRSKAMLFDRTVPLPDISEFATRLLRTKSEDFCRLPDTDRAAAG
jgi:DNA invertase Pin-like site-specific DNA recombinase